jgi:PHS family inorganic phosphate transporter-like MFS transporter
VQLLLPHVKFNGISINSPNSNGLGWVLIIFSFVMASATVFSWAWIPDLQDSRREEGGPEMPSKTLEELAEGKRRAEAEGQIIGIRAKLRHMWFLWRTE